MSYDDINYEVSSGNNNLNIREALCRLVGHPILLHLASGQTFHGIVLGVMDGAVRIISGRGCRTLIPFCHISAVREPQFNLDSRCIRGERGDGVGTGDGSCD